MAGNNHFARPLIVALAVGIAFITTSVIVFGSGALFSEGRSDSITIGVDGIDGRQYRVGDELNILVKIQGVAIDCAGPHASIVNTNTSQTIWDSGIRLVLCDPDREAGERVDITWHLGQYFTEGRGDLSISDRSVTEKIVPSEAGYYELRIIYGIHEWTFLFTVYPASDLPPLPSSPVAEYLSFKNVTSFISTVYHH